MQVSDIRTFVPCKDFAQSQLFYQSLGFTLDMAGDDLCLAQMGDCYLFLQRYYLPEFAENMMLQIIVDDIDDIVDNSDICGGQPLDKLDDGLSEQRCSMLRRIELNAFRG